MAEMSYGLFTGTLPLNMFIFFKYFKNFFIWLHQVLVAACVFSSLTRGLNRAPCIGRRES